VVLKLTARAWIGLLSPSLTKLASASIVIRRAPRRSWLGSGVEVLWASGEHPRYRLRFEELMHPDNRNSGTDWAIAETVNGSRQLRGCLGDLSGESSARSQTTN
jgi:hypothetical protein